MINSDFFHRYQSNDGNLKTFVITDEDIHNLKMLKSVIEEGSYHNSYPVGIVLTWKYVDNEHISKDKFARLFPAIQFISMTGILKDEFIKKYDVKDYHISLLRRLYMEYNDYGDEYSISIGYKRPFGNSHVSGDVEEEISRFSKINLDAEKVLQEFVFILDKLISEEGYILKYTSFEFDEGSRNTYLGTNENMAEWQKIVSDVHHILRQWKVGISEIRNRKINQILI